MNFITQLGAAALGSRFRRIAELFSLQTAQVYEQYQVDIEPGWFPVFYFLAKSDGARVTEIAAATGHSHPFISKIVGQLKSKQLIDSLPVEGDKRARQLCLSAKGRALLPKLEEQVLDVSSAMEQLLADMHCDLLQGMTELEAKLEQSPLSRRVKQQREKRAELAFDVLDFEDKYQSDFYQLNRTWIEKQWVLESSDLEALENPRAHIIDKGGEIILIGHNTGAVVATCALIKMSEGEYELAKMAVSDKFKGLGLGYKVGLATLDKARAMGAKRVYLETNSSLTPAISLYHKLGFKQIEARSAYDRGDVCMEIWLEDTEQEKRH